MYVTSSAPFWILSVSVFTRLMGLLCACVLGVHYFFYFLVLVFLIRLMVSQRISDRNRRLGKRGLPTLPALMWSLMGTFLLRRDWDVHDNDIE